MPRLAFCVRIALLVTVASGCRQSPPPGSGSGGESQSSVESVDGNPAADPGPSPTPPPKESPTLKQAMIDVAAKLLKNQSPENVQKQIESAIEQIRMDRPDFLIVSADTEVKLKAGVPVEGAAERIADAEVFLTEYDIQPSGLVAFLLPFHHSGTLDPVRTELLSQLIVVDKMKAQEALTN